MTYRPPANILEVLQKIEYEEALPAGDPRFVETQEARGSERTFSRLARKFGWDPVSDAFFPPNEKHALFFGHIGSGKTTELRRYAERLNASRRYYVVEVDVLLKLDRNNLQYSEALMAMAETLLERLLGDGYALDDDALWPVREWFETAITTRSTQREASAEIKAGAQAGGGLPGLVKLFASFTAAVKTGASQKDEWRQQIRNRFTTLAAAFSQLIRAAEAELQAHGRAERVFFLVDGTDKMRGEDTRQFFVLDAEQLLAIQTLAIYTAPLHLKFGGLLGGKLDADMVLPMIKLHERDGSRCQAGWTALTRLLLLRADRCLFAADAEIEQLAEHSGGHPRELLRLLRLCCEVADDLIDGAVVQRAIAQLAADYRYFLRPSDYALLVAVDANPAQGGNDEAAQDLLHRLALMQYNDGRWRRSHPVVRTLEGYQIAAAALPAAAVEPAVPPG
ncbi:ATP-binding protein [Candidatus Accumulibacter sp. ACC003]|uniref:ATP-binding protein n=1 Tax=Candidatus Accumulibacter sp. ACC003 TaxID=2823334 RepID=UPI0025BB8843|nr:ATP-binding protein [Candidatus Accumulibacter sp. ACC003]